MAQSFLSAKQCDVQAGQAHHFAIGTHRTLDPVTVSGDAGALKTSQDEGTPGDVAGGGRGLESGGVHYGAGREPGTWPGCPLLGYAIHGSVLTRQAASLTLSRAVCVSRCWRPPADPARHPNHEEAPQDQRGGLRLLGGELCPDEDGGRLVTMTDTALRVVMFTDEELDAKLAGHAGWGAHPGSKGIAQAG